MFESFLVAINAVIPFLFYLIFGHFAVRSKAVEISFLNRLNKMVFSLFFPFLTFYNLYKADHGELPSIKMIVYSVVSILTLILVLLLVVPRLVKENRRRGVIIQGIFRSNFVLYGVALTINIFGEAASSIAAVMIAVVVSIFNVSAVVVLEMFNNDGTGVTALQLLKKLAQNPLLQGAVVGLIFYLFRWRLPQGLVTPIGAVSNMTTPLAMFVLGGTLRFDAIRKNLPYLVPSLLCKLVLVPLIFVIGGYLIGLRGAELFLLLAIFGTPMAAASYPMAQNMGGDGELAGQMVFLSTVLSVFTLFGWIFVMNTLGILF